MKRCELSLISQRAAAYTASVLPRRPFRKMEAEMLLSFSETVRKRESEVKREIKSVFFNDETDTVSQK